MERARQAGLREDWRGTAAYLCSPWLWRGPAYVGLQVVLVLALAACVGGSLAAFHRHPHQWAALVWNLVWPGLLLGPPAWRNRRRRRALIAG